MSDEAPRVMLVIHSLGMGGAEMMVRTLACELHDAGHPVCVVSLHGDDTPVARMIRDRGVRVVGLGKRRGPDPGAIASLVGVLRDFAPSTVHTHLPVLEYVVPAVRIHRGVTGPRVRVVHTFHSVARAETRSPALRLFNRLAFHCGVVPVALSEGARESVCAEYGLGPAQVPIVRNGIELGRFAEAFGLRRASDELRLLCVARLHESKNHALLLDVLAELVRLRRGAVRLTLVGDGPLRDEVRARAASAELSPYVTFAGQREDVAPFYRDADVFVLLSRYEGVPMSVIEAMAAGLPVVATPVGGIPDILRPGVNGLFAEGDAAAIAGQIAALATDARRRLTLGEGALGTAREFSARRMMEGYLGLYR